MGYKTIIIICLLGIVTGLLSGALGSYEIPASEKNPPKPEYLNLYNQEVKECIVNVNGQQIVNYTCMINAYDEFIKPNVGR